MTEALRAELAARLDDARTRRMQKELGSWLDDQPESTRRALLELVRGRGVILPDEALSWPGKRLVRRARGREEASRQRRNPIRLDEQFDCLSCGAEVPVGGRVVRDHCPWCLCSVHIDSVPGDRKAGCGGIMEPVGLEKVGSVEAIHYRCVRCTHKHRCRSHPDDDREQLIRLSLPRSETSRFQIEVLGLVSRVRDFCAAENLLSPEPVGVAVSGGVDSMVLLHVLAELGLPLEVLTVDHGLRPESAEEVGLVRSQAEALGFPFHSVKLDMEAGAGIAERARLARYSWMESLNLPTIALGHQRDDQIETVLDRLTRGAGSAGLSAMSTRRGIFVRPLLRESRKVIEAWATTRSVPWLEDPSNRKGTRGTLRHAVLPVLSGIREGVATSLARSAELLAQDDHLLQELSSELFGPDGLVLERWDASPSPLRRRAAQRLVREARGESRDLSAVHLDALERLERPGSWIPLPGGWRLVRDTDRIRCLPTPPRPSRLTEGVWGLWRLSSDEIVHLRPPDPGERLDGSPLRERLRAAGISPGLRPYHPVVELGGRRWVPGVWLEKGEDGGRVKVRCERMSTSSVAAGGPFDAKL